MHRLERLGAPKDMGPPSDAALQTAFGIERMVVSGELVKEDGGASTDGGNEHDGVDAEIRSETCQAGSIAALEDGVVAKEGVGCDGLGQVEGCRVVAKTVVDPVTHAVMVGAAVPGPAQMSRARCDDVETIVSGSVGAQMSVVSGEDRGRSEVAFGLPTEPIDLSLAMQPKTVRLRICKESYIRFMALERAYERHAKVPGKCFLEFMLEAVWEVWGERFKRTPAYHDIYVRDRNRCTNPVCHGRVLNPHHLRFRSRGGPELPSEASGRIDRQDEPENVASVCFDCHIPGVHMGRIPLAPERSERADSWTVEPPASNMRWVIGRNATLVVQGREKISSRPGAEIRLIERSSRGKREAA